MHLIAQHYAIRDTVVKEANRWTTQIYAVKSWVITSLEIDEVAVPAHCFDSANCQLVAALEAWNHDAASGIGARIESRLNQAEWLVRTVYECLVG